LRFVAIFGVTALLVVGGMGVLAYLLTRLVGGDGQITPLVWLGGCCLSLALPLVGMNVAMHGFRNITAPLADVMEAADQVAEGNLSVRVPEDRRGGFGRLAQTFNRMTSELERADQQRRNLTADVAHELRTPLHVVQGNLEGILDGVYAPTPEHIRATLDETRLLARLIDDLRTLSLAESGQLTLRRESITLGELVADVATSFSGQAEAAGIALHTALDEPTAATPITVDVDRMNQVLGNLLMNALRHTPPGGAITLGAERALDGLRLVVGDTGEGITPEDLPYIFDRFWRGDRARTHADGTGAGLGLAIARQLVQLHGGRIEVESQVGRGTTFTIHLPNI
jgi:two-component system OmpR family sensor kinase/two-component system sensor histidine kinase BaeS